MHARLLPFIMCLAVAVAVPAWAAGTSGAEKKKTSPPVVTVSPGGYKRDPSKAMEMKQYMKSMRQKQMQAAANRAASRARAAELQKTEGGTK